ncbi:hypothetical protein ACWCPT_26565 [Streptomyces sp. NPDC002308]
MRHEGHHAARGAGVPSDNNHVGLPLVTGGVLIRRQHACFAGAGLRVEPPTRFTTDEEKGGAAVRLDDDAGDVVDRLPHAHPDRTVSRER